MLQPAERYAATIAAHCTAAAADGPQIRLQAVAEHLVNQRQRSPVMPEQVLPAPKGSLTAKMLLQLGIVAQSNLHPHQNNSSKSS